MIVIDTPYSTLGKAHMLAAAGILGVIRYCSPNSAQFPTKCVTLEEVQGLHSVGIKVGLVYERLDTLEGLRGTGTAHAQAAVAKAKEVAATPGVILYHAVDLDVAESDLSGTVEPHFADVHAATRPEGFLVGDYGSGDVCEYLLNAGLVHGTWLAGSAGWSGYDKWKAKANIVQGSETAIVAGLPVDMDEVVDWTAAGFF